MGLPPAEVYLLFRDAIGVPFYEKALYRWIFGNSDGDWDCVLPTTSANKKLSITTLWSTIYHTKAN